MKEGPNFAFIGSLIGDPARANMLSALMGGKALTASELALEAGVKAQTASAHLSKLEFAGLVQPRKQGRHRYFMLTEDVAQTLENLMGIAAKRGHLRSRIGPKDSALREARVCYDHLAGDFGVLMLDSLLRRGIVHEIRDQLVLSDEGTGFISRFNIGIDNLRNARRPVCLSCLDWSARRSHLAGSLGAAFLQSFYQLKWMSKGPNGRALAITEHGRQQFLDIFQG